MSLRRYLDVAYALLVDDFRRLGANVEDAIAAVDGVFAAVPAGGAGWERLRGETQRAATGAEDEGWKRTEAVFAGMGAMMPTLPPVSRRKKPPSSEAVAG